MEVGRLHRTTISILQVLLLVVISLLCVTHGEVLTVELGIKGLELQVIFVGHLLLLGAGR